ncbi:hypothetical protein FRC17_008001, partial [Serendipita sp. 399]
MSERPIRFRVGIIFKFLDRFTQNWTAQQHQQFIPIQMASSTHWRLVFTANGVSCLIELYNDNGRITYQQTFEHEREAHYFGTYTGYLQDLTGIAQSHRMNGQSYW